jgi:hypothetical protein
MAGAFKAITEIVAWISPSSAAPARELFAAPFVPRTSFRGPQPHVARTPAAFPFMVVADDEEDWDNAWNQFNRAGSAGVQPGSENPQPLESLPPADIPVDVDWDAAWMQGMKTGFQKAEDAVDKPETYSPLDQQKEKIEKEAWSRPDAWGGVDPDAWQDQLSRDGGVVDVPENYEDKPLYEQLMFLTGQQRGNAEANAQEKDDVTEKDEKVYLKNYILKPLVAFVLSFTLSAYVYTVRPTFVIAAPASLGAVMLALYSGLGFVKIIFRALTMARVGLA